MPEDVRDIQQLSVQDRTEEGFAQESPLVFYLASLAEQFPAWPSPQRDIELAKFWRTEPTLAGAVYSMVAKVAALDFKLQGPGKAVSRYKRVLMQADLGQGWPTFVQKVVLDYLTQDNGGFIEIIRPRRGGPTTPVVGVAHLDAQRCRRTGDIRAPIDYVDAKGTPHRLKWYEVLPMTDLPSPREQHHGVGFCAVSRILRAAQTLRDIGIYKRQKLSGKRPPGLLFVQGLRKGTIESALQEAQQAQMERGDTLYTGPIILASQDPGQAVDVRLIELAGLPDHYDEDTTLKWYISQLALAFGTDYTEFAPLPGGGLGSGQQTTEMAARARGKGPGVALQQIEFGLNYYVLPPSVEFQFASTDPTAERDRVQLRYERGRERALRVSSGELTPQQALELAVEEGDAPEKFLQGYAEPDDPLEAIVREVGALRQTTQEMERLARNAPRPAEAPRAPLWRRVLGGGG